VSLRERLQAKQRRQLVVPVHLTDAGPAHEALTGTRVALAYAEAKTGEDRDEDLVTRLQQSVVDAEAVVNEHIVLVTLQALERADWRAVLDRVEAEGWDEILPDVIAASCVDADLQDAGWWREQFARPEWSDGDVMAFRLALGELNTAAPEAYAPKG
jgi:hypothetical protein